MSTADHIPDYGGRDHWADPRCRTCNVIRSMHPEHGRRVGALLDLNGRLLPHHYWPDLQAMGDCLYCCNVRDIPEHEVTPT